MTTVRLEDYLEDLKSRIPGLYWGKNYQQMGLTLGVTVQMNTAYEYLPGFEYHGDNYIKSYLNQLVEQLHVRAIRELGLRPKLDAYEAEAKDLRMGNKLLKDQLERAKARIGELELALLTKESETDGT